MLGPNCAVGQPESCRMMRGGVLLLGTEFAGIEVGAHDCCGSQVIMIASWVQSCLQRIKEETKA
jgi:hypothetical protein